MAFMSDVQSTYLASSGNIFTGRTRVKGIYVVPNTAGSIVIKDGGASGTQLLKIDTTAGGSAIYIFLPEDGLLCTTSSYAVLTGVNSATFFWA